MKACFICDRIKSINNKENKYFVVELTTSYVVLGDYQFYKGYTLLLSKTHTDELHKLPATEKKLFLFEMSIVAEAVNNIFKPKKLNYELLGNKDSHMHWHIYPRHENDPDKNRAIWAYPKDKRCNSTTLATSTFLRKYKPLLKKEILKLMKKSKKDSHE
jgi:diadenosine tetraphosphate (Ap4A) HIT family hydrolase